MRSKVGLLAVLLVACGGTTATTAGVSPTSSATTVSVVPSTTEAAGDFPVTVAAANGPITIDQKPEAIVSLEPTATEMLAAIGALDQVVAVDDQSDYPPEVPVTDLSVFTPNIEAIASYEPDLVVVSNDIDGMVGALQSLDIPTLLLPAALTLDDVYAEIEQLGAATGHVAEAVVLTSSLQSEIGELVGGYEPPAEPLTYYHELDTGLFSVTSATFIGSIYSLFGLHNIADAADPDGFGYPQLSAEYIITANPDFIFLADTQFAGQNPTTVAARPGWAELSAVTEGRVVELDDDVASRWGPRVVDFVGAVAEALALARVS
ncbi:MAG: ABC transporter substrate-binding protein [Acidimicrobiia bacterium]